MNAAAYAERCTVNPVAPRTTRTSSALTPDQGEAIRALVRALLVRDWNENQTRAAQALGVEKATINQVLSGRKRAGLRLVNALGRYLSTPAEQILASGGDLDRASAQGQPVELTFGDLPGWPALLSAARESDASIPAWVWPTVARARVWLTVPVTVGIVLATARIVRDHVPPPGA